jgi:hypothetical protein
VLAAHSGEVRKEPLTNLNLYRYNERSQYGYGQIYPTP